MAIVAGVDFGTLSVRVSIVDSERGPARLGRGRLSSAPQEGRPGPRHAEPRRSHARARRGHPKAPWRTPASPAIRSKRSRSTRPARASSRSATALEPLDDYYLWCDHRAWREAALITETAHRAQARGHRLVRRHLLLRVGLLQAAPLAAQQPRQAAAGWPPPWSTATWSPPCCAASRTSARCPRSVCAMGHKWMWNQALGGLPPEDFLVAVDPLLAGVREKLKRPLRHQRPDRRAVCRPSGPRKLGLRAGIPIPVGAFDAHWDAIGAGVHEGDVVNVVGTSTCIMAIAQRDRPDPRRLRRGAGLDPSPAWRVSRPASRPPATSSKPSPAAPQPRCAALSQGPGRTTGPARPACCASPGTTATARCW